MKKLPLIIFLLFTTFISKAQITGSAVVCPGYIYVYHANIIGATSYTWAIPAGWLIISGQGSANLEVMCNVNDGDLCVDGYDGGGIFIAQNCFTTGFGGDGAGWDADKTSVGNCICSSYTISVMGNGSSSPCGGCGNGTLSPNAVYAVYDTIWPIGNYLGLANGITLYDPLSNNIRTLRVYLIDTTLGINNAALIGSPCSAVINNTVQIFPCSPPTLTVEVDHSPVCVGEPFSIRENSGLGTFPNYLWASANLNINFTSALMNDTVVGVYNGLPGSLPLVTLVTHDMFGCPYRGEISLDIVNCIVPPIASFAVDNDSICPGQCVNFQNTSINGSAFSWYFQGADIDTSSFQNPLSAICYSSPGTYTVTLLAVNGGGNDSAVYTNFITVFPNPILQNLILTGDTLYSIQGFSTYTWYFNGSLIPTASLYYYVPLLNGNYTVVSENANGCLSSFELTNILLSADKNTLDLSTVFPNPASSQISVTFNRTESVKLRLINSIGEIVSEFTTENKNLTIDLTSFTPGIYTIQLISSRSIINKKLIIQK